MVYSNNKSVTRERMGKLTMFIAVALFAVASVLIVSSPVSAQPNVPANSGSLGEVTLDTVVNAGINYGTGISDGEWVVAETQGVQIGLRATNRTDGLLDVSGSRGNRVGVYEAETGFDGSTTRAEWNYEWTVDLSNAIGDAEGRTVSDYSLSLEQDYTDQSLFGQLGAHPVSLPMVPGVCANTSNLDTLCQQSWNPVFGNTDFDVNEERVYHLRLVLIPATFNGPPQAVAIQVNVSG